MRFLFLSYSFPGPLGSMAQWLGRDPANQVIFACSRFKQELPLTSVQRVVLKKYQSAVCAETWFDLWDEALAAARSCAASLRLVGDSGFVPDMIFNASSNGIFMGCRQVYPDVYTLNFLENESFPNALLSRMRGELEALQLLSVNRNFLFPGKSRPEWLKYFNIKVEPAPMLVDAEFFHPKSHAKALHEPACKRHVTIFCYCRPGLVAEIARELGKLAPGYHVTIVAANSFVNRKLKEALGCGEKPELISWPRMDALAELLANSALCLYVEGSPDFLPAESCGAPVFYIAGNNPVFIPAGVRLLDCADGKDCAVKLVEFLANPAALDEQGELNRQAVLEKYATSTVMPGFFDSILAHYQKWRQGSGD